MKSTKIWLCISVILMVAGIGLAALGTAKGGTWRMRFDFKNFKLSSGSEDFIKETKTTESFNKLIVNTETFDVNILKGNDYSITYNVPDDKIPVISNKDGVLTITAENESGLNLFNFASYDENPYINITIPDDAEKSFEVETSTGDVSASDLNFNGSISTSTGDIKLSNNKMGRMLLHVSTGDITVNDCSFDSLNTEASTGDVKISNTSFKNGYNAETSTGDITIKESELSSLTVNGSTSDITVISSKINDTLIHTSTGEVKLDLIGEESGYSYKISTSTGDININGKEYEDNYNSNGSGSNSINIETSTGDIDIDFR